MRKENYQNSLLLSMVFGQNPKMSIPADRASQEEQNGANLSYVAPSSEELFVHIEIDRNALL